MTPGPELREQVAAAIDGSGIAPERRDALERAIRGRIRLEGGVAQLVDDDGRPGFNVSSDGKVTDWSIDDLVADLRVRSPTLFAKPAASAPRTMTERFLLEKQNRRDADRTARAAAVTILPADLSTAATTALMVGAKQGNQRALEELRRRRGTA